MTPLVSRVKDFLENPSVENFLNSYLDADATNMEDDEIDSNYLVPSTNHTLQSFQNDMIFAGLDTLFEKVKDLETIEEQKSKIKEIMEVISTKNHILFHRQLKSSFRKKTSIYLRTLILDLQPIM